MKSASAAERDDARWIAVATALARRGLGRTNPNPPVGCVLVRNGRRIAGGFHERAGEAHAEARALASAGPRARGATAYVTLEPCAPNAAKRTPPCAPALLRAGVARVVYAVRDENPRVRGRGIRLLRRAGIAVSVAPAGDSAEAAQLLAQHFNAAERLERPYVALKAGISVDAKLATATGRSRWITSPVQRRASRALRRLFDGVIVGSGTAIADDPLLLPRPRVRRRFIRIVLDSRLRLREGSRLARTARAENPVWVLTSKTRARSAHARRLEARGVRVVPCDVDRSGRLDCVTALRLLAREGLRSVLVEGGSEIHGAFVARDAFDELLLFRAPVLIGGSTSPGLVGGRGVRDIALAPKLRRLSRTSSLALSYLGFNAPGLEAWAPERPARSR